MALEARAYESVTVETHDRVARVTLIGAGEGKAMGPAFWSEPPERFAAGLFAGTKPRAGR
jgi:enoyl-CoA hydratase